MMVTQHEIRLLEYEMQLKDISKAETDLRRFVETKGYNPRMKCIAAEKFQKFMKDYSRKRDSLCDELRLQNGVLLNKLRKMKSDLRLKASETEEISKSDYDKYVLLNKEVAERLKEKLYGITIAKLKLASQLRDLNVIRVRIVYTLDK
ncbi:unnamed protein product [Echinostoma caproni]|uniref:Coiled-coil domain-containing protein 96 n=1 Tax=Echinostoma caproni TaxID=27848 RepID=A0A183B4E8_9TREM|nr:unnamed protein product [Echinostoma caproni]